MSVMGLGVVVAGTVIIHPLIFLGGAVWAVGVLSAMENGYSFFSNTCFSNLFWTEPSGTDAQSSSTSVSTLQRTVDPLFMEQIEVVRNQTGEIMELK
eukprot:CAMPEP_0197839710 /NCGR_PEP_ID=MMETSP1437-20131217/44075_1 /TAXON_ID=49252 ORGANISM="Eucampia antarctica, Strain CCMP1452" /NCGR_SAMPLE_ID=MMETSP1437 /ASSEMBLY_ACC=CAM_ASM_001096 /LENGTH=96 /DNA_ID=CAMNT_0043448977 /DNA_START=21 /DNA_END=308 /DNA_ORIENTATION=+